jgi:hypothetical protein
MMQEVVAFPGDPRYAYIRPQMMQYLKEKSITGTMFVYYSKNYVYSFPEYNPYQYVGDDGDCSLMTLIKYLDDMRLRDANLYIFTHGYSTDYERIAPHRLSYLRTTTNYFLVRDTRVICVFDHNESWSAYMEEHDDLKFSILS